MCGTSDIGGRIYLNQPSPGSHNSAKWLSRLLAYHEHHVTCMVCHKCSSIPMVGGYQRAPTKGPKVRVFTRLLTAVHCPYTTPRGGSPLPFVSFPFGMMMGPVWPNSDSCT